MGNVKTFPILRIGGNPMSILSDVLANIDKLKPNQYDDADKIAWIQELDGIVTIEVLQKSEKYHNTNLPNYTDANKDVELLICEPYTDLYIKYVHAQIDFNNGEYDRYNNNSAVFNGRYEEYKRYFLKNNIPYSPYKIRNV